jgi:hypothetical protein
MSPLRAIRSSLERPVQRRASALCRFDVALPPTLYRVVDELLSAVPAAAYPRRGLSGREEFIAGREELVASRCVEFLQAELDCIRWPGVSADFGPGGVS